MLEEFWLLSKQGTAAAPPAPTVSKTLYAWGEGLVGKLGLNDTLNRSSPVQVGASSWIMVSAGYSNSIGIGATNLLYTWGASTAGELGNGQTIQSRSSPINIGSSSWSYVYAAFNTQYAIRADRGLFVWGRASGGMHGLNDNTNRNSPVQIGASSWTMVAGMFQNAAGITTDNRLFTWGLAQLLGAGVTSTVNRSSPIQVISDGNSLWTQISVGLSGMIGIRSDGVAYCWGLTGVSPNQNWSIPVRYNFNQLTVPVRFCSFVTDTDESNYVTATGKTALSWRQTVATGYGGIMLRNDGKIFVWGRNSGGQIIGYGTTGVTDYRTYPAPILPQSNFNFVGAGGDQGSRSRVFAINTAGQLFAWGNNAFGTLGVGDTVNKFVPTLVNSTSSFVFVAGGSLQTAAIGTDGSLFTWGSGTNGALGNGTTTGNVLSPAKIGTSSWYQVGIGHNYMAGITGTYKLFAWGIGGSGCIGDGNATTRSVPTAIGSSSWIMVTAGASHAHAIRSDSTLWSWGNNLNGQLGNGGTDNRSSPVQVTSPVSWKFVDAANDCTASLLAGGEYNRSYGIPTDNTLYAWGVLNSGMGMSTFGPRSLPVQISTSAYTSVNAGLSTALAIRNTGTQYFFGIADQFAGTPIWDAGSGVGYSIPQVVPANFESWIMVNAGYSNGSAIRSDYKLFVWGQNGSGQLGLGTADTISRSFPTQLGSSSWTQVVSNFIAMTAIDSRQRLFWWGSNSQGVGGVIGPGVASSPIQVGTSSWTMVSSTWGHVFGLRA